MSLTEFRQFAATHNVIPVARKLTGSNETPLSIYSKLANHRPGTFLLESAEAGIWARYSFIGVNSEATLTESNGLAVWSGVMPAGAPFGIDPLSALRVSTLHLRSPKLNDLPPLTGGLVGYLGYEIVRRLEKLPTHTKEDIDIPEIAMTTSPLPASSATDVPRAALVDLEQHHCRWPCADAGHYSKPVYCGENKVPGLPYCEHHARRAYHTPQPAQRSPDRANHIKTDGRPKEVAI